MTDDNAKRTARQNAIRGLDADRLEASLAALAAPAEHPALVVLVVLVGLPGSGKSYFARALAARYPAAVLDSDALRAVLYDNPQHTQQEHGRLFPAIHVLMERLLSRGVSVVLDATNVKESSRRPYYKIGEQCGAPVFVVRVTAPREVIRARLAQREARRDPLDRSTANLEVYEKMRADVERIARRHISVNTGGDISTALDKLVRMLPS